MAWVLVFVYSVSGLPGVQAVFTGPTAHDACFDAVGQMANRTDIKNVICVETKNIENEYE
jgi:hypothetical protein